LHCEGGVDETEKHKHRRNEGTLRGLDLKKKDFMFLIPPCLYGFVFEKLRS